MRFPIVSILCLGILFSANLLPGADLPLNTKTESLIDQLPETSQLGYGYSAQFSGSQFLPMPGSENVNTLVLGSTAPAKSETLKAIVEQGAVAIPSLLKHMDDARETKMPAVEGMMWMAFNDEYDFNRRLRKDAPQGVNKDDWVGSKDHQPSNHTITVGDLCFVALGQIVNRNFNATRYQPTGGLIVNSPTYSKALCKVIRDDFSGLSTEKHREFLVQEFLTPDTEDRRIGAYRRLAYYYPKSVEKLVLKQLTVPTYDGFRINQLLRDNLYPEKDAGKRKQLFEDFVRKNGRASADGILLDLFNDLGAQIADEEGRLSPPLSPKYDARALLVQLYGYKKEVISKGKPYVNSWEVHEKARFIQALVHDGSPSIDKAVYSVFLKAGDDDYLALACMELLAGKKYDQKLRQYCERRLGKSEYHNKELEQMLNKLNHDPKDPSERP